MNRLYRVTACLLALLLLAGCEALFEPPDLYPYSFSNPNKHPYPRTLSGARRFIEDATDEGAYDSYPHWRFADNGYVRSPALSERLRTGDCDDYAVMMAHYLQEYWGYDTFIVFLDMGYGEDGHAVTFVCNSAGLIDTSLCLNDYPYLSLYGSDYVPVDWTLCPDWMWRRYGGSTDYLPPCYTYDVDTGHLVFFGEGAFAEWYEMVNLALDADPERDAEPDPIPAVWSSGGR